MTDAGPNWYVAQTHANSEGKAASQLERQGFEIYLPRYIKTARHARRVRMFEAPLFPRYLFVRVDIETQRWRTINSTFGITQLVGRGNRPSPVLDEVIDLLKRREGSDGLFQLNTTPQFKIGDAVRVSSGAFEACQGFFDARTDQDRVAILLEFMGRQTRVLLDVRAIEHA
jgi:transcriptional antiterminator RfaH